MKRREFVAGVGMGAMLGAAGCAPKTTPGASAADPGKIYRWRMVTTWPPNLPGLGTGANFLAKAMEEMSGGRIRITVFGAGELVPPFEVFDTVSSGAAELGHGASYYWKGKSEAAQFFTAVPFGMTSKEMNAWLYNGGGLELWREIYADFGLIPALAGNTGVQMGGWFNREIKTLADLKGLKMRIPGIGGEILKRAGGTPVSLPGSEVYTAMQTGSIDAAEWVGPYNDQSMGLHQVAKYYYYPGWQEPGPVLECIFNKKVFEELPADLQAIALYACRATNDYMPAEYDANNGRALASLVNTHNVQLRRFPPEVLQRLREISMEVLEELAQADPVVRRVYDSYLEFAAQSDRWLSISEKAYLDTRPPPG